MPPFTTVNGQTGYYMNGQFVPATQQEYDAQFNAPTQGFNNPFLPQAQQPQTNRTDYVTQGTIQSPENAAMSNEQKVMQKQGNESNAINNPQTADPYQNLNQDVNAYVQNAFSQAQAMRQTQQSPYTPNGTVIQQGPQQSNVMSNPLVQGANNAVFQNPFINPAAPTQTQVTSPVAPTTPEITPTTTTQQTGSGNFFNNMFNKPSDQVMAGANEVANPSSSSFQNSYSNLSGELGKIGAGGGFKMDAKKAFTGSATTSLIGGGINAASKLIGANAGNYDERVGMTKPNLGSTLLGDATFTQMGSMFGPAGMAIGGTVDLVKNAIKYVKQKDKYENKKLATNTMQSIDDARENMKPDYTGYARFGAQINNPYIKKYQFGGKGDPEDPIKDVLNYSLTQPKKQPIYGLGANPYQPAGGYNWGSKMPNKPTEVVNTTGSGHSQTMPSPNASFQGSYDPRMPGEKALQAADKAIGQYVVQPAMELFNTPFATFAEGVNALQGKEASLERALPNPTRMALNAQGIQGDIPNQQFLSDYVGVDKEKNPYLALGLDIFTPTPAAFTKPLAALAGVNKAAKGTIQYASKMNALDRAIDSPLAFARNELNPIAAPKINPNFAMDIADNLALPPKTLNTVEDLEKFSRGANSVMQNLDDVTRNTIEEYADSQMSQAAPLNVNAQDYGAFLSENVSDPQVLNSLTNKMEDLKRRFPFLNPNNNMSPDEIRTTVDNARNILNRRSSGDYGINTSNPYMQMMNDWADQQRILIRTNQSGNNQNISNFGPAYNQNVGNQIQQTSTRLPNLQNSGYVNNFNVKDFIQSFKSKSIVDRAKQVIEKINYNLGKKFYPLKTFDEAKFTDEVNTQLQKGLGIKKDDYKISVEKGYFGYDVNVIMPGETQATKIGKINLSKSKLPQQKTLTEGLSGKTDKNLYMEKPNDFPYQEAPHLEQANTGIGAEIHKAMSNALKKQDGIMTSSTYHLPAGIKRYLHEAINERGAIPLEGFTDAHMKKIEELRQAIGKGNKKIKTKEYIDKMDSKDKNALEDMFRNVRWRIPKVTGVGTAGAAATYGIDQLMQEK